MHLLVYRIHTKGGVSSYPFDMPLFRWTINASNDTNTNSRQPRYSFLEGPTERLAVILEHMAEGRVEQALSAATAADTSIPSGSVSLESLIGFAANPIYLGAIEARMRLHELRAKVTHTSERSVSGPGIKPLD